MRAQPFRPPIDLDRLAAMIAALQSPWPLGRKMRREIVDALDWMYVTFGTEAERSPGRNKSAAMHWHAYRVNYLVAHHGAYLQSAVLAVLGADANYHRVESLTKAYRALKAATNFREFVSVDPAVLARDAARLPQKRRR